MTIWEGWRGGRMTIWEGWIGWGDHMGGMERGWGVRNVYDIQCV